MSSVAHKVCCTCKQPLPLSAFGKDRSSSDGLKPRCRTCRREEKRQALADPVQRARMDAYNRDWVKRNPEKTQVARERRRDKTRAYGRAYYVRNKAKMRSYADAYYRKNRMHLYVRNREWQASNAERAKETYLQWRMKNRGRIASWNHKRRSRDNGGGYTQQEWDELCAKYGNRCLCCNATDRKLTADHVVALSKDGSNNIQNIQPLCLTCNQKKGATEVDYR